MPRVPRSARRGLALTGAALVTSLPLTVALASPAAAATSLRVSWQDECAVRVALSGLTSGPHSAVVAVTALADGAEVPAVRDGGASRQPATSVVASRFSGDTVLRLALDASAVPDLDPRVRVAVAVDGGEPLAVDLTIDACGAGAAPLTEGTGTDSPVAETPDVPGPDGGSDPDGTPDDGAPGSGVPSGTGTPGGGSSQDDAPGQGDTTGQDGTPGSGTSEGTGASDGTGTPDSTGTSDGTGASDGTDAPDGTDGPASPGGPVPGGTSTGTDDPTGLPSPGAGPTGTGGDGERSTSGPSRTAGPQVAAPSSPASPAAGVASAGAPVESLPATSAGAAVSDDLVGGTGTSGYLALSALPAPEGASTAPVPAPVIAPPVGAAAGSALRSADLASPLDTLLPVVPAAATAPAEVVRAAPQVIARPTPDPVADLAPAGLALSALLGSRLLAGVRRRLG